MRNLHGPSRILRRRLAPLLAVVASAASGLAGAQDRAEEQDEATAPPRFEGTTEVVASRVAGDPADAGRSTVVLTRDEIAALPVETVQDVLAILPGVGLARRGARGVQGDLNLRGSTFEQALVMVNGVRVNNPQTGHHSLDLFLPAAAIERVEVLYGPGSAVHGPDAFGGAVNIVTAAPATGAWARVGEHRLLGGGVAGAFGRGLWAAVEREAHAGFRDNTELDVGRGAGGFSWQQGRRSVEVMVAAGARDFGAHAFYSRRFPDQRESTEGELVTVRAAAALGASGPELELRGRISSHRDDFVLDRARPEWYRNRHRTEGALIGATLSGPVGPLRWAAGLEGSRDEIRSSNLGAHHRARSAVSAELGRFQGPATFSLQARLDHQAPWGSESSFAAGGAWRPAPGWRLRAHWGQSFRAPSFTELHYVSPATVGNAELAPERGATAELGLDRGPYSVTLFERVADPIIDYLLGDDGVWRAANLGRVTTRGVELALTVPAAGRLSWQRIGLVALDSEVDVDPRRSAYALAHPELEAVWSGAAALGEGWTGGWAARFRDPGESGSWATLDLRLDRRILDTMTVSLEAANLLDRELEEFDGVPLPGRWLSLTLRWRAGGGRGTS